MLIKKYPPYWNAPENSLVALDDNNEIIATGETYDEARTNAIAELSKVPAKGNEKKKNRFHIERGNDLQRPSFLPSDVNKHRLVLIAHNWRTGRIFYIKQFESPHYEDLVMIHGAYLDDLIDHPWAIIPATKVFLSSVRIRKKPYEGIVSSKKDHIFAYEPMKDEVEPYVDKIRYYIENNNIFDKTVPKYRNRNCDIKNAFKELLRWTK